MTFNSEDIIERCLDAIAKMAPTLTPIVVDNASTDRTVERARHRGADVVANAENRGFAAAVNQGIEHSDAEFLLLLNPDTRLLSPLDPLLEASRRYGLAAGRLVDSDGRTQIGFTMRRFPTPATLVMETFGINRLWPSNPVNRRYRYLDRNPSAPGEIEQPAGAFLMTRRDVWERLGGFDERFHPIWFEDVDYCRRAVDAGFRIEYVPKVAASHVGAHSINQVPSGRRALYWCVSLLKYADKHFGSVGYRGVCAAIVLSSVARLFLGVIQERSLKPVGVYSTIVRFAGRAFCKSRRHGVERAGDLKP